jgi:hypothetical protein
LLFFLSEIFSGCVSSGPTKPNEIYNNEYPPFFENIREQNNLLAEKIGKLPELQDGIQDDEESALRILCDAYKKKYSCLMLFLFKCTEPVCRK